MENYEINLDQFRDKINLGNNFANGNGINKDYYREEYKGILKYYLKR
jgi:hypothetical protein